jgi:hypothetical protein
MLLTAAIISSTLQFASRAKLSQFWWFLPGLDRMHDRSEYVNTVLAPESYESDQLRSRVVLGHAAKCRPEATTDGLYQAQARIESAPRHL